VQVSVRITGHEAGWTVTVGWGVAAGAMVRSFEADRLGFTPWIKPQADWLPPDNDPDHDVLSGPDQGLQQITGRVAKLGRAQLEPGDLVRYGRLLYGSVLAPVWDLIVADASAAGELVELALDLPSTDPPLQQVLWELLHDGRSFLVTHEKVDVAITRRIPSAAAPAQIAPPARVLFAIGAELLDPDVRAGAEFLGLMRELERFGWRIASYIIERASMGRVAEAVEQFRPDVVHFIAHGHHDAGGEPALLMRPEDDVPGARPERVTAEKLYSCVSADHRTPSIVVLAACDSGAVSAAYGMPLAEDLVRRGIPIVVAMAGSVADQACRLFTRRFGTVLASGGSLLQAAADARLAAYRRNSGPPSSTIDWALPSVFLSSAVPHDYHPVAMVGGVTVCWRIQQYDFGAGPVFCGRSEFLRRYDDLMSQSALNVLAIYSAGKQTQRLGKTRLLREYGVRALLDGHVPCVVGLDGLDRPSDPRRFAEAMLWAIVQARRLFKLEAPGSMALLNLICSPDEKPALNPDLPWRVNKERITELLATYRHIGPKLDSVSLAAATVSDLGTLIKDARDGPDPQVGPASRVLVLLDSVEAWGDTVHELLPRIRQYGLGDEDESVPVVMAFRANDGLHDAEFGKLIEWADNSRWIDAIQLKPLAKGAEEGLAYQWILLNANPAIAPPISERIYTVVKPDGQWRDWFGLITDRIPAMLSDTKFYAATKMLLERHELAEGDDDEALRVLLGSRP
jgi:hypothetical protein